MGEDEVHRLEFDDEAGGPAVRADGDPGGVVEGLGAGQADAVDHGGADDEGVRVAGHERDRHTGEVPLQRVAGGLGVEGVDVEVEAGDPDGGALVGEAVRDPCADRVEGVEVGEVEAAAHLDRSPDGVGVGVGEARGEGGSGEVEHLGGDARPVAEELVAADGDDPAVADGHHGVGGRAGGAGRGAGRDGRAGGGAGGAAGRDGRRVEVLDPGGAHDEVGVHGRSFSAGRSREGGCRRRGRGPSRGPPRRARRRGRQG